jgi:hypothetical protein
MPMQWTVLILDGSKLVDERTLHEELCFKLQLPAWYGRNQDALLDVLSSLDAPCSNSSASVQLGRGAAGVFRISNSSTLLDEHADLFVQLARVIGAANQQYAEDGSSTRLLLQLD